MNRVILWADGQASHGITDPEDLVKREAGFAEEGIATTTIGYGEDFNENLLTTFRYQPGECLPLERLGRNMGEVSGYDGRRHG